jgi:hypothetical protein
MVGWIRIRQKLPTKKVKKFRAMKIWIFSFEGRRLLLWIGDVLQRAVEINVWQFLMKKYEFFATSKIFGRKVPGSGTGAGSGSALT